MRQGDGVDWDAVGDVFAAACRGMAETLETLLCTLGGPLALYRRSELRQDLRSPDRATRCAAYGELIRRRRADGQ